MLEKLSKQFKQLLAQKAFCIYHISVLSWLYLSYFCPFLIFVMIYLFKKYLLNACYTRMFTLSKHTKDAKGKRHDFGLKQFCLVP